MFKYFMTKPNPMLTLTLTCSYAVQNIIWFVGDNVQIDSIGKEINDLQILHKALR